VIADINKGIFCTPFVPHFPETYISLA